jgi:DNA-binding transcriptional MocR family regulator
MQATQIASMPAAAAAPLSRHAGPTLAEQLAAHFAERIGQRQLRTGARLPSVRECARRHALSPSTVVAAYDRLLAAGLVEARRQRGFFVRETPAEPRTAAPGGAARAPLPVSATMLIRGMFQPPGALPMPGLGTLPADWLDLPLLAAALHKVSRGAAFAECTARYGEPAGDARLRQALSHKLAEVGVAATPQQLITTIGATQALDVVTRTLLRPGDAVLVDEPGWAVEYARLSALGMRLLPVPRGDEGPDLGVMQQLIEAHSPRLYVTVSVLHNPTGASLSLHRAHQLLRLAEQHDLQLVEDDTYAHLASPHLPRLSALDGLRRSFYISGFSKILAPNWRVGYLAAPPEWVDRLVDTKLLSTLTTPSLTERALALCLEQGLLRRHAERVMQRLDAARAHTVQAAEAAGFGFAAPPRGLFGWVDAGCDTERLAEALLEQGWLIAPGALFHATQRPTTLMRINFATTQARAFWHALRQTCSHIAAA